MIYKRRATKGAIYRGLACVREINRSFDMAIAFDYPVALVELPDGRPGIIHCPVNNDLLEIEDAETGKNLSQRTHNRSGFYHSQLNLSPDGKTIVDQGWRWHPIEEFFCLHLRSPYKIQPCLMKRVKTGRHPKLERRHFRLTKLKMLSLMPIIIFG